MGRADAIKTRHPKRSDRTIRSNNNFCFSKKILMRRKQRSMFSAVTENRYTIDIKRIIAWLWKVQNLKEKMKNKDGPKDRNSANKLELQNESR